MARIAAAGVAACVLVGVAIMSEPAAAAPLWAVAGATSVAGIMYGVHLRQPAHRGPWHLLAASVGVMAVGDVALAFGGPVLTLTAEILYLAMFPLLGAALLLLTRANPALRDRSTVVDLLSLVVAAGLVGWTLTAGATSDDSAWGLFHRSIAAAHVLGSVVLVVVMAALAVGARGRNASSALLVVGALGLLVADVFDALAALRGADIDGTVWELGYLVCYAAWGGSALPAAMTRLTEPAKPRLDSRRGLGTVPVLIIALTAPALLLLGAAQRDNDAVVVIAVGSILMTVLVATRLGDAITAHQRAMSRERLLRRACGELVGAVDGEAISRVLVAGINSLLPAQSRHQIVFVGPAGATAEAGAEQGGKDPADEPDEVLGWQPRVALEHPPPAAHGRRRTRLSPTRLLHPDLRALLDDLPATLVASLAADRPARYRPPATAVAIAGDEAVLAAAQDTIEVLVGQAALALHRVGVTDETSRRDRDAYLSAVGERTADVVILLDTDEWIRYASPSLVDLLRVPAPVFATWRDIFHRDDQAQVENTLDRARAVFDGAGVTTEWTLRRADGSWIQVSVDCRDLRDHPAVQGLVITMRDITDDRRVDLPSTLRRLDRSAPGRNRRSVWRRFG
jgi:PAS domain S-box-containing protein